MIGLSHIFSLVSFVAFTSAGWILGGGWGAALGVVCSAVLVGIPVTLYEERCERKRREDAESRSP